MLQLVGCSHHTAPVELRERIAFSRDEVPKALVELRHAFPDSEAVLLSTCNRVELYTGTPDNSLKAPSDKDLVDFLAQFHGIRSAEIEGELFHHQREKAVRHLFRVAASLDSMVMGEAQILSQVKEAYQLACDGDHAGPLTHAAFQGAIRVARKIANETSIHRRRISIPSVAVADFASQIFERFDDKQVLVIGAGEMGRETLRYLADVGARHITIVNRNIERASELAKETGGRISPWEQRFDRLIEADLVVSTTGANEPVVTHDDYLRVEAARQQRPLFVLDLAVPRDFEASIGERLGVYLYSVDDLQKVCEANQKEREKEWPRAEKIINAEADQFLGEWNRRVTGPAIRQLRENTNQIKQQELERLMNKLNAIDDSAKREIEMSFDRLVNKLLHPPMESLRDEAKEGGSDRLLDALKRLFQLK